MVNTKCETKRVMRGEELLSIYAQRIIGQCILVMSSAVIGFAHGYCILLLLMDPLKSNRKSINRLSYGEGFLIHFIYLLFFFYCPFEIQSPSPEPLAIRTYRIQYVFFL